MFFAYAEERLLQHLMSKWQRRGSSLLHIGLHSYTVPEFFWDAGFDVSATDEHADNINFSRERSGPRIEYHRAKGESLPFDDDSFDYAFFSLCMADISLSHGFPLDEGMRAVTKERVEAFVSKDFFAVESVFAEACRVAQRGVIFVAKNAWTMGSFEGHGKKMNPYSLWKKASSACPVGQVSMESSLVYPRIIQKKIPDMACSTLPVGALLGVRMDFNAPIVRGLGLLTSKEKVKNYGKESAVSRVFTKK